MTRSLDFFSCDEDMQIKHLLTHTMGIGHKNLCQDGNTYENIGEYIASIPADIPIGSDVLYSCPAFILLGKVLEKVFGEQLDVLFKKYVAVPIGLSKTGYCPNNRDNMVNANQTDDEFGIVHDYNCRYLGGIAGNAGLFSCIADLDTFCKVLLNYGGPLYSKETFMAAAHNYTPNMGESRGLGFVYVDSKYIRTGNLLPEGSIGHGGYTGQLLFVDYKTGFYAIILTDITKCITKLYGFDNYEKVVITLKDICNAIHQDLVLQNMSQ